MSLFSTPKESSVALVFDIGSGSVGAAIILTSSTHTPTVLYSFRSDIPFQEEATGVRLLSLMLRSLSQAVLAISHEGFDTAGFGSHRPHIQDAFVSLSAPWVLSKTSLLKLHSEKPVRITHEVFATLLQHDSEDTERATPIPQGSLQIEQKLIRSVLNGYETGVPYDKMANEAEFAVFGSFSVPRVTERISDTITHLIHPKRISFHSFSLAAFAELRELYPDESDFMFADISGEQTELSVVKRGTLIETLTFPFGRNQVVRILQKSGRIPPAGASALLKLHAGGKGAGRLLQRSQRVLEEAQSEWRRQFIHALSTFSEELFIPQTLFLTADEDVSPLFCEALKNADFKEFTLSSGSFKVVCLGSASFDPLVMWAPPLAHEPFIAVIAAFANKFRR